MTRRINDVTITQDGRDKGKVFRITEMSAAQAEEWAMRALVALTKAGADIPATQGMAGIAVAGLQALGGLNFPDVKALLDEMFTCIKRVPEPLKHNMVDRPLVEDDTEEVATRLLLRAEVFALHTGFSLAGVLSNSTTPATIKAVKRGRTSPRRSPSQSPAI